MKNTQNTSGYSIVVSILMVGFLLVITSGVFHLVLSELNDNRGRENYLRASAGAEGALELALLSIKQQGYGYYSTIANNVNDTSVILSKNPLDASEFKPNDVRISYDMDSKVSAYSGSLTNLGFDIIPLFYINPTFAEEKVEKISFQIPGGETGVSWNIISDNGGISGEGNFDTNTIVKIKGYTTSSGFDINDIKVGDFLADPLRGNNYLILFNTNNTGDVSYNLVSQEIDTFFTKPRAEIISSSQVGKYRQNFRTTVDNTEYLNVLKYSVFSN